MKKKKNKISLLTILLSITVISLLAILIIKDTVLTGNIVSDEINITINETTVARVCRELCESGQLRGFCLATIQDYPNGTRGTCYDFSTKYELSQFNVDRCNAVGSCIFVTDYSCVTGLGGWWETPIRDEYGWLNCAKQEGINTRKVSSSDSPPISGQICCRQVI